MYLPYNAPSNTIYYNYSIALMNLNLTLNSLNSEQEGNKEIIETPQ